MLRIVGTLRDTKMQQTVLSLIAAVASGTLLAGLCDRLRASDWFVVGALGVLVALAAHSGFSTC